MLYRSTLYNKLKTATVIFLKFQDFEIFKNLDWKYLCVFNEIANLNLEVLKKIRNRVKWSEKMFKILQEYSQITSTNADLIFPGLCQVNNILK